jgi:hypothetical protein
MNRKLWIFVVILGIFFISVSEVKAKVIQVNVDTVNPAGQHLENGEVGINSVGSLGVSPSFYRIKDGEMYGIQGKWGGLTYETNEDLVICKDTTYSIDAITGVINSQITPGVNKINLVFDPIQVEVAVTDQTGKNLKYSQVTIDNRTTWQNSPQVYIIANGGYFYISGQWIVTYSKDKPLTIFKNTTYWFDASTGDMRTQYTPGVNKINLVFKISSADVMMAVKDYLSIGQTISFLQFFDDFDNAVRKVSEASDMYTARKMTAAVNLLEEAQRYLQSFINEIQSQVEINNISSELGKKTVNQAKILICYLEEVKSGYSH